jgi:hypothetical protein
VPRPYPNFAGKHAEQALFTAGQDAPGSVRDKYPGPTLLAGSGNSSAVRALVMGRGFCSGLELSLDPAAH